MDLFQHRKWIPAFAGMTMRNAGMTLRSLPEMPNPDFFTRSFEGMTFWNPCQPVQPRGEKAASRCFCLVCGGALF
jgi:hypothetical protein